MGYAMNVAREVVREVARAHHGPGAPVSNGAPVSDADSDFAEDLGDEIATLAAHIHAATHRFLVLIARFDRLLGWEPAGHRTCAHWLAFRTGLDLGTAREHVRVARALEELPHTNAAMARGALAFSQVRALTRVAKPDTEDDLLVLAEGCTTAQLERVVRAWKRGSRKDEAQQERERHRSRTLSVFPDEEGMYVVTGLLDPEVGALLMRALEAASDALYRKRERVSDPAHAYDPEREAARRRADAVGLLAERALAAGFGSRGAEESESRDESSETSAAESSAGDPDVRCPDQRHASGASPGRPPRGTRDVVRRGGAGPIGAQGRHTRFS